MPAQRRSVHDILIAVLHLNLIENIETKSYVHMSASNLNGRKPEDQSGNDLRACNVRSKLRFVPWPDKGQGIIAVSMQRRVNSWRKRLQGGEHHT